MQKEGTAKKLGFNLGTMTLAVALKSPLDIE